MRKWAEEIPIISIGDFNSRELAQAWRAALGEIAPPEVCDDGELSLGNRTSPDLGTSRLALPKHLDWLCHPPLFDAFSRLDCASRKAYLRSHDQGILAALADPYVGWFCKKAVSRRPCSLATVRNTLKAVAKASLSGGDIENRWIEPAWKYTGETRSLLRGIFDDAASCGVINTSVGPNVGGARVPLNWSWRFEFVRQYLESLA